VNDPDAEIPSAEARLFIDCRLDLGEGPIWHPGRAEFIYFDVNVGTLYRATIDGAIKGRVDFGEPAAAAAIVDDRRVAVITATALVMLDLETGVTEPIIEVEADNPGTRSNDSRVDPSGGFWIGTMGHGAAFREGAGAYYHYRAGTLQRIYSDISVPNSTCFTPDGTHAYFADSATRKIMKVAIDAQTGMPTGTPQVFVDLGDGPAVPDGSVVDAEGFVWNAEYHGGRVVRYSPDGAVDRIVTLPVSQVTCPCLGGPDLKTMLITTASQGLSAAERQAEPLAGSCFVIEVDVPGLPETPIRL
jgi:sugar lactone lactonase YvrE